jgi:hypothetical protein
VTISQDDDVIQTFSADTADYAFHIPTLPRLSAEDDDLVDAKGFGLLRLGVCEASKYVAVSNRI